MQAFNCTPEGEHDNRSQHDDVKGASHVMFVLSTLSVGGSEKKTIKIANALALRGWQISIAYLNGPHDLIDEISDQIDIVFLDRTKKFSIGASRRLVRCIEKNKVDLLFCINLYPLLYGYLSRCLVRRPISLIATTNVTHYVKRIEELKMFLYSPILRRVDAIVFGSEFQKSLWVKRYKLNAARCCFIYNGVDTAYYRRAQSNAASMKIKESFGMQENGFVVGSVGRFSEEKKYQTVIQACVGLKERGHDVYCLLVGGGPTRKLLEDLVIDLQCQQYVFLVDMVQDVRPFMGLMDIFVLSSPSETFSNAALEAMAMGLPVVLPKVGGCPEMVESGVNGFVFEPDDIRELAECLRSLIKNSELRRDMGKLSREYVKRKFQFETMVQSYATLIENIEKTR